MRTSSSPETTALVDVDDGDSDTYREFDRRVSERLAGLQAIGLAEGDAVGLLLETGMAFAELYFAIARAGSTAVPLNLEIDRERLASQVERAELDLLVADSAMEADAVAITPDSVPVVSIDEPHSVPGSRLEEGATERAVAVDSPLESEQVIMFTSGTTGPPKGVRITLGNLVSSAVGSAHRLGVSPGDRWLVCLPMYHMGGLAPLVRSTLYGTTTVIQSTFDAAETADVIREYDVTCVSLVPTMLKRLLDAGWDAPDHLRFVLLGGGPASESLVERCEDRAVPVCPTYGATETASQVATALPETAFERRGTVGRPLRGTTVRVLSNSRASCRTGEPGEIVVDGPTVSPGYLDAERTAMSFGDYGFQTGDVGYRDEAGRLWIVGRVDDQILTGGETVQPATVAGAIRQLDPVDDVIVLGMPDDEWGERVTALVESTATSLSASTVRDRCRGTLADYEIPKTVRIVETLPRTPSGTVDRERARSLIADGVSGRETGERTGDV